MFKTVMLSVVLAFAAASPISFWGSGLTSPSASSWTSPVASGVASQSASPISAARFGPAAPIGIYNYRGPLSLAPGQPANILAADGRPLETFSVNLDRAVHNTARALEGRRLQKRSLVASNLAGGDLAGALFAGGRLAAGHLAATSLVAAPLTLGRAWVGPALAPVALGVGGRVENIW